MGWRMGQIIAMVYLRLAGVLPKSCPSRLSRLLTSLLARYFFGARVDQRIRMDRRPENDLMRAANFLLPR